MNQETYLKNRVDNQIEWYDKKSVYNKRIYYSLSGINVISAACIPLTNIIVGDSLLSSILGLIIIISTSFLALSKCHENWISYRTVSESLKHEKHLFITNSDSTDQSFNIFVNNIESLISKENSNWSIVMKKQINKENS